MTAWSNISNAQIDQDSPVDQVLLTQLRDNPRALAEQASGAPKIALKSVIGSFSGQYLDVSVAGFLGARFSLHVYNSDASLARTITFDATDGSYLGAKLLATIPTSSNATLEGFFDFATGIVHGVVSYQGTAATFNQTISGASTGITGIRFTQEASISGAAIVHPNGGQSAS